MPLSFQPDLPHVNPRNEEDIIKVYISISISWSARWYIYLYISHIHFCKHICKILYCYRTLKYRRHIRCFQSHTRLCLQSRVNAELSTEFVGFLCRLIFTCCTLGKLSLGEFSLRKRKFWRLENAKPARITGLGNPRAKMSLELAHVSLFAGYWDLEAATNTRHVGCFFVMRKLLLVSYCYLVWILFSVFLIFCITSFCGCTRPQHKETIDLTHTTD